MSTPDKRFMRDAVIQLAASHPDFQRKPDKKKLIKAAEWLWEALDEAGYGSQKKSDNKPRKSKDWYNTLTTQSQLLFCQFWQAFSYTKGRNEAAQSWSLLGETDKEGKHKGPNKELADKIIEAAKKEARREIPKGQARKMAQGWLSERRWEDAMPAPSKNTKKENEHQKALAEARADVAHFTRIHQQSTSDISQKCLDDAKAKLAQLQESKAA